MSIATDTKEVKKKRGGKPFVKGDPRCNRKGGPKTSAEVKALKKLTLEEYIRLIAKYLYTDLEAMKKIFEDPKTPAIDLALISIIRHLIRFGDVNKLEVLLKRLIGDAGTTVNVRTQLNHKSIVEYIESKKD